MKCIDFKEKIFDPITVTGIITEALDPVQVMFAELKRNSNFQNDIFSRRLKNKVCSLSMIPNQQSCLLPTLSNHWHCLSSFNHLKCQNHSKQMISLRQLLIGRPNTGVYIVKWHMLCQFATISSKSWYHLWLWGLLQFQFLLC